MPAEAQVERTYGNWRRPRPPGLWHLGLISSVLLIVGLIAAIIVIALVGLVPGLVLLALMGPVFLVTLRPDPLVPSLPAAPGEPPPASAAPEGPTPLCPCP